MSHQADDAASVQEDDLQVDHSTDTSFSSRRDDTKLHLDRMEKLFSEVQAQQTQVLAVGRSRSTARRSCKRRATEPDMHPLTGSQIVTSTAVPGAPPPPSVTKPHASPSSCREAQPLGAVKVQRSLTWTEEGQAGVYWGSEGGSDRGQRRTVTALDSHVSETETQLQQQPPDQQQQQPDQQQQQPDQQQQQHDQYLSVNVQASMTVGDATRLQSSPCLQSSRHDAALHRQKIPGSASAGLNDSVTGSSNSGQMLVPARFQAGSHDAVNRSEWYSYNPMSSVTTLGTSGSDAASTLGGLDQSSADCVLMASPIRGTWATATPTKLSQSSFRSSHSPFAVAHPSGMPRSPFQPRPMPHLSLGSAMPASLSIPAGVDSPSQSSKTLEAGNEFVRYSQKECVTTG
ncbi:hypothetical protein ABBQ32_007169 [Trebouxia sp. C0010 RCD-2024]